MTCAEEIASIEKQVRELVFPNLEDGTGEYGEKTLNNAVEMVKAVPGFTRGFEVTRVSKSRVSPTWHTWGFR